MRDCLLGITVVTEARNIKTVFWNVTPYSLVGYRSFIGTRSHHNQTYCLYVDKKNQLDVTFCILYFSSNSCSTCFGQQCAHHQEVTKA